MRALTLLESRKLAGIENTNTVQIMVLTDQIYRSSMKFVIFP